MPHIPTYESNVNPEAPLPGRSPERLFAEPGSFGAASGIAGIGAGLDEASDTIYDTEQRQEVSDVAAKVATLRGSLTAQFIQGAQKANGDPSFTDNFMQGVTNQLDTIRGTIQTRAAQMAFERESAGITSDFLAKGAEYNVAVAGAKEVGGNAR